MGVTMNPVTSGPMVNDRLETGIEGVFACGNVSMYMIWLTMYPRRQRWQDRTQRNM